MVTIHQRWMSWSLSEIDTAQTAVAARKIAESQNPDGCWDDVLYSDSERSTWKADLHLERLNTVASAAAALRRDGHLDAVLEEAGEKAIGCWIGRDPQNPNWWWNEIGAPQQLGRAALLLRSSLTTKDRAGVDHILRRAVWSSWTGQNLVWGTSIQVLRGLLDNDEGIVREGFTRVFREVSGASTTGSEGAPTEGIQRDGSFHQHGAQLYSGGYGHGFGVDVGIAIVLTWGTRCQIDENAMLLFAHFILDGQQWMMRRGTFDYLARGREITREQGHRRTERDDFGRVLAALAALNVPRRDEFSRFAGTFQGGAGVEGNRNFWNSDYIVDQRAQYTVAVRMLSRRTKNEEVVNAEGARSVHLTDGASLLYMDGSEYRDVFPVWDWSLIPGTTALRWLDGGTPKTGEERSVGQMGVAAFAGGVSDGEYGAAAMELDRGALRAKKAWFFFDGEYVALGTGIDLNQAGSNSSVLTTLEQKQLEGSVVRDDSKRGVVIVHDHVSYVLPANARILLQTQPKQGRWSDIGTGRHELVTMPMFLLAIDHGPSPHDASYRYIVIPDSDVSAAKQELRSPRVKVLRNNAQIQAVESVEDAIVEGVFYQAGTLKTFLGSMKVSEPCAVMLRRVNGRIRVAVANPRATALKMEVFLDRRRLVFSLEGGDSGGRSVLEWVPDAEH